MTDGVVAASMPRELQKGKQWLQARVASKLCRCMQIRIPRDAFQEVRL
jgi:hypothetical protein